MSKYQVTFNLIFREQDYYNEGCDSDSGITEWLDEPIIIESDTVPELLKSVQDYFNVEANGLLLNSCDEIGRLDVQTYTKGTKGFKCAYKRYKEVFQLGQCVLWLNNISGTVIKLPEAVDLSIYEGLYI